MNKLYSEILVKELIGYSSKLELLGRSIRKMDTIKIGVTPRVKEFESNGMILYRYENRAKRINKTPILLVYSLVNRPEIADLSSDRSLVKELCELGFAVYLIDWGNPEIANIKIDLETYIVGYLGSAVDYLRELSRTKSIHLVGLCQGGTFAVCYTSLFPEKVSSLTTTATPVDFHSNKDRLSNLVRHLDLERFRDLPETISGAVLNPLFLFLKPHKLLQEKYITLLESSQDMSCVENFFKMEKWIFDSPFLSTRALKEFVTFFYQKNSLIGGTLSLNGTLIEPRKINAPVLNIFAKNDHIVPVESSKALPQLLSHENYTEVELNCGHVGVYVGKSSGTSTGGIIGRWIESISIT